MITVFGIKGAPGATTVALLLAALQPDGGLLVELDPDGGDLALRLSGPQRQALPAGPGLAQLAVSATELLDLDDVAAYALRTAVGVPVVCAVPSVEAMSQLLHRHGAGLATALARLPGIVIDAGRLVAGTPAMPFALASSTVVVVVADRAESFFHARDHLASLLAALGQRNGHRPSVVTVVVADPRRGPAAERELETVLAQRGLPAHSAGWLAHDRRGVDRWLSGDPSRRTVLLRTATPVMAAITAAHANHAATPGPGVPLSPIQRGGS